MPAYTTSDIKVTNDRQTMRCRTCSWTHKLTMRLPWVQQAKIAWNHLRDEHGAKTYQADCAGIFVTYTAWTAE